MTHSLADIMLAQLHTAATPSHTLKLPDQTSSADVPPAFQPLNEMPAQPDIAVKHIPLSQLRIDPHQPRNYLPADLRAGLVHHSDARTTLQTLIARAAENDVVATGTLEGIRALARSIADIGLQQPIRVAADKDNSFRIVDGERRFWAYLFLRETTNDARYEGINAIMHAPEATADEVQRAQWAANLCREDIPAVDFAEIIAQIRERYLAHVAHDRAQFAAMLGEQGEAMTTPALALALTQREVARLTGRTLSERHLYSFLAVAERLKPQAKALARGYNIGLRPLKGIVRLPETEQLRLLKKMAGIADATQDTSHTSCAARPGRPTSLQRSLNACISLKAVLHKLTDYNLSRQTPADVRVLLAELDSAAAQIAHARKLALDQLPASDAE